MAILDEIKTESDFSPEQIFDKLLLYSNFDLNGLKKGDPDKKFNVYFETNKYKINYLPKSGLIKTNTDMLAELTLTKIEGNKTHLTYKIKKKLSSTLNEYLLYVIILILTLALIPVIMISDIPLIVFISLTIVFGIYSLRKKRKILAGYRNHYLELWQKIK